LRSRFSSERDADVSAPIEAGATRHARIGAYAYVGGAAMSEQKVVLVTGGGQGIGKAIAARLLDEGAAVVLAELDEEAGRETAAEYAASGRVHFVATDVADERSVQRAISSTLERFGALHALVNNAGIAKAAGGPLEALPLAEWNRVIGTNLTGAFLMAKHCAPQLRNTRGAIVNVASTRALQSEPNTEAYVASKGGVVALTHALALSLAPDVRVHCVSPGWIDVSAWKKKSARKPASLSERDHAQHPVGRVGKAEDVAALVAFLLGPEAGFLTGENFVIDGGMTRKMIYAD
jgi:NAD(P)-dependent dehydrogenase (short-subunit alcohol dehydrogenase family)